MREGKNFDFDTTMKSARPTGSAESKLTGGKARIRRDSIERDGTSNIQKKKLLEEFIRRHRFDKSRKRRRSTRRDNRESKKHWRGFIPSPRTTVRAPGRVKQGMEPATRMSLSPFCIERTNVRLAVSSVADLGEKRASATAEASLALNKQIDETLIFQFAHSDRGTVLTRWYRQQERGTASRWSRQRARRSIRSRFDADRRRRRP